MTNPTCPTSLLTLTHEIVKNHPGLFELFQSGTPREGLGLSRAERDNLEFIGDRVLYSIAVKYLYKSTFKTKNYKIQESVSGNHLKVSALSCNTYLARLFWVCDLPSMFQLPAKDNPVDRYTKKSFADFFEAMLGLLVIQHGVSKVERLMWELFDKFPPRMGEENTPGGVA